MYNIVKGLAVISVLAFVAGVMVALTGGEFMRITAESFSRTCNHLLLFAIVLMMMSKHSTTSKTE